MEIQKSTGIVLSSRVLGEADILCNILTKDSGKRKFIFKGLKKSKKRSLTATEPGSVTNIVYYFNETRDSFIAKEFNAEKHYFEIRKDLNRIYNLYFILETVEKTTGYNDTNNLIFDLLASGIDTLSRSSHPLNLSSFFLIHLLRLHGILPNIDKCEKCGSSSFSEFTFDVTNLGLLCSTCARSHRHLLNLEIMHFINDSLSKKYISIYHDKYNMHKIQDLLFYLSLFIEHYFNIEIKSKDFILKSTAP